MRPLPTWFLLGLLVALCGLCVWQWQRETALRRISDQQTFEGAKTAAVIAELTERAKFTDAEILRLTGALNELKTTSVAKDLHDEATTAIAQLKTTVQEATNRLTQQQTALTQQNLLLEQANATIQKLTAERDALVKRLNEPTASYNKLLSGKKE